MTHNHLFSKAQRWQTKARHHMEMPKVTRRLPHASVMRLTKEKWSSRSTLITKSHSSVVASLMTHSYLFKCPFSFRKRQWAMAVLQVQSKPKRSLKEKPRINLSNPVLSQTCNSWTRTFGKDTLLKRKNMPFVTNQVWCRKHNSIR